MNFNLFNTSKSELFELIKEQQRLIGQINDDLGHLEKKVDYLEKKVDYLGKKVNFGPPPVGDLFCKLPRPVE